jgi:hypothetical protein
MPRAQAACCALGIYPVTSPSSALESRDSASASCGGSSRPRFAARRRIPRAALGLKKYLDRSGRVSKTSDKEDATAALGDSEPLSIQNSPRHAVPEVIQVPEDGTEIASPADRQEPWDILAEEPTGTCLIQESHHVPPQSRAWVSHAAATPGNRVPLAWPAGGEDSSSWNKSGCS